MSAASVDCIRRRSCQSYNSHHRATIGSATCYSSPINRQRLSRYVDFDERFTSCLTTDTFDHAGGPEAVAEIARHLKDCGMQRVISGYCPTNQAKPLHADCFGVQCQPLSNCSPHCLQVSCVQCTLSARPSHHLKVNGAGLHGFAQTAAETLYRQIC